MAPLLGTTTFPLTLSVATIALVPIAHRDHGSCERTLRTCKTGRQLLLSFSIYRQYSQPKQTTQLLAARKNARFLFAAKKRTVAVGPNHLHRGTDCHRFASEQPQSL